METINLMTKQEFIYYMAELFKRKGYLIKTYDTLPSYGIDFIIEKNSLLFGVQVNNNYLVNSARIKSIISGIPYYQTQFGIVVSTKGFSDNAKMLALACNIILWDQEKTIEEVKKAQSAF
jgi:HJR/Mrr/RecB family endonuclease